MRPRSPQQDAHTSNKVSQRRAIVHRLWSIVRPGRVVVALVLAGVIVAGFMVVSGRASALGFHWPESLTRIFASKTTARTAPAARTVSAPVVKPMAPSVATTIVNYDFNSGTTFATLAPSLASGVTSTASSTEAFATVGGAASGANAFTSNATAGNAITMANSSGTNTRYYQFQLGGASLSSYTGYKVYAQGQRSATGATTATLAYSTDGTTFTNFGTTQSPGNGSFAELQYDVSAITAINSQSNVYFRILVSGASATGTFRMDNFQVQATLVAGGTPTKLAISSISPISPTAGSGFNVTVQSQDGTSAQANVVATTAFTLSNTLGGTIGGTTTGSITAGTSSIVVSGVTLSTAATGVTLTATRTSGDTLTAGTSALFNVLAAADHISFVGVPSTGAVNGPLTTFTVEARRPDNSVDTTYTGNVVITKATGSGALSGTTTKPSVAGVATFNNLQFDAADTYTLHADSSTFSQITSGNIVVIDTTLASDFFRSRTTGSWATPGTWESSHDGSTNWITATLAPDNNANTITVRNTHTVTVDSAVSADQLTVDSGGQITIASTFALTLTNGTGTDLTVNGTVLNSGTFTISSSTWAVNAGGTFIQNTTTGISGALAVATLDAASTFIYRGSSTVNVTPSISARTYGNLSFESTSGS